MLRLSRFLLAMLWLGGGVSLVLADSAAENRAFKEARSAFDDTIWDRAERQFAGFIERYPDSPLTIEAVLYRAQALFKLNRFGEAIPLLEERKAGAGKQTDLYLYWIGEAHFQSSNYVAAATAFAELTRNHPGSAYGFEASLGEAEARARLRDWPRVTELLGDFNGVFYQASTNRPGSPGVIRGRFLLAQASLERNNPSAALAAIQPMNTAILNAEQTWQRQQLLARVALAAGRADEADRQSTNLVLLAGLTARPECIAESWALRGQIHERLGQTNRALEAYSQNLGANVPLERQREALGKLAELHLARGETDEAMRKLAAFLERSTNTPAADVALLSLAEVHLKQHVTRSAGTNHLNQALALLDRLVTESPQSSLVGTSHLYRGWCYWFGNQIAQSRAAFTEAVTRLPASESLAVAQFKVGDTAYALGDFTAARDGYRAALATMAKLSVATNALTMQAWYQLERACLALKDAAGAEEAMRKILGLGPVAPLGERSFLLAAQGFADAQQPERAAVLFAEFSSLFPDSALRPEVDLAAARVAEQRGNWTEAEARYVAWGARFPNHPLLPQVEFYRARSAVSADRETNAYGFFTNFVTRFPTNDLVPAARYWLGDYFFRQGDYEAAEIQFSTLYHYWPKSELAPEACMMAGRSAIGRLGYREAITHFTNLTANPNCPPGLKSPARFAYGSTLRLLEETNPTNRIANLKLAALVFGEIRGENPGTATAAEAWGEIGNTYYQLGTLDPEYYAKALEAFQQATNIPAASSATRGLAGIGCGLVLEKLAAATSPPARTNLIAAFNQYLDVLYEEAGDPFARQKAGLDAIRVGRELGQWPQVEQLCVRMQKLFPPLHTKLEKRRLEAVEKTRGETPRANGPGN